MKKLDKYILKAFVGPFVAILFLVVFILMIQFLWLYIDELVGKGLSLKVVLEFILWGGCTMLPLSMPLATVLASMMTMASMAENSELTAVKAAGISLSRQITPLVIACFLISVGAFFVANNLVPVAYNKIFMLRDDINKTKDEIKIPTKTFYDGIDGYVLRIEENDSKTDIMKGVMVYNHTANRGNISLTMADSAIMKMSDDKSYIIFTMMNGINYEENNEYRYRDTTRQVQRTRFTRQEIYIPLENYGYHKSENTGRYADQAKCMSMGDLVSDQDSIRTSLSSTRSSQIEQMRADNTLTYSRQLDSARNASLSGNFDLSSLPRFDTATDIRVHASAVSKLNSYIATMTTFDRDTLQPAFTLKLIDIEIFKKFALALACFLLFFIGAPLGALIRKGGIGTPAIVSVLFFVLYYIIDIVGTKLARDGAVAPFNGAFISTYILAPIGIFMTYKAIKDEEILGTDKVRNWWRKVKISVMEKFKKTRIVFMGTPEFAVAPLKALLDAGYNVVAVVTVPDKPSGRGLGVSESAVKKFATAHGIPVLAPEKLSDAGFISALTDLKPDIFAVVAFRLLPRQVWSIPRLGTFNLHAALLPQYRGAAPINWAVINGEKITGVTSFLIDDGVDTGTIMMREQYRIQPSDTASDVHDALQEISARMIVQTVEGLIDGKIEKRVQKSFIQGEEVLHKAPKLSRELAHIDWSDTPEHIVNLIRGLSDYPGAFTELVFPDGSIRQLKIYRAHIGDDGKVVPDEVQLQGKKRMSFEDFRRGFREWDSCTFTPGTSKSVIASVHASEA